MRHSRPAHQRTWRFRTCWVAVVLAAWGWIVAVAAAQPLERYTFQQPKMGTEFVIVLYAPDSTLAHRAATAVFARIDTLNQHLSDYLSDSEVNRLSATAGSGRAMPVSDDLWAVLRAAQRMARATDGAFDVTVGPMTRLWRWAWRRGQLPSDDQLQEARAAVGYRYVHMDSATQTVWLERPGMRLDFGGIAKGYAADEALKVLASFGISRALVDAGGDVVLGEPPPATPGWRVMVDGVDAHGEIVREEHLLARKAVATSGDTYRYIEVDGVRYSHLLDPRTGLGVTHGRLVTVVALTGTQADALASALSVMAVKDGLSLIDNQPNRAARIIQHGDALVQVDSNAFSTLIVANESP